MVAADQMHSGRVFDLEGKQKTDGLERVGPSVDVVAEEKIVDVRDVSCGARGAVFLKQTHQVAKLAV